MPDYSPSGLRELRRRVANDSQIARVELVQALNGAGAGSRYILCRTISGITLRVAVDRGFDIDELAFEGQQIGWQGPSGNVGAGATTPDQEGGNGLLRGFSGFMVTCGYDYFGGARTGPAEHFGYALRDRQFYPLHGRASLLRADILASRIDWDHPEGPTIELMAEMRQAALFGENLVCLRRITIGVGTPTLRVEDVIRNDGMKRSPHQILYHLNFGYPLIDAGTRIEGYPRNDAMPATLPDMPQPQSESFRFEKRQDCAERIRLTAESGLSVALHPETPSFRYVGQWWNHYDGMECIGVEPASADMPSLNGSDWRPERHLDPGEQERYVLSFELTRGRGGS